MPRRALTGCFTFKATSIGSALHDAVEPTKHEGNIIARLLLLASDSQPLSERTVHDGVCKQHVSVPC
jgi:hypothetical protein